MWGQKVWLFPVSIFLLIPSTFIVSYIVAVFSRNVAAGFPYISDTGAYPPASCIFGEFLNIGAVLAGITIYIRYRDIEETLKKREIIPSCVRINRVNVLALALGICSALGGSIVANFQETSVIVVHYIGAFMIFCVGAIYCWVQTYLTYKLCMKSLLIAHLRLSLCLCMTTVFIILFVCALIARNKFTGSDQDMWQTDDGGFAEHIAATASEWVMAITMMVFFLTFVKEFWDIGMKPPTYYRHSELQANHINGHLSIGQICVNQGEVACPGSPKTTSHESHDHDDQINRSQDGIATITKM